MGDVAAIAVGLFTYQFGGAERIAVDLAVEFRRRGYRVVCFAFHDSDGPMRTQLEELNIRCLDMSYPNRGGVFRRLKYLWRFWRMLRREQIRALHVHHTAALILCGIPAWLARVPRVLMTEHALQWRERPRVRGPARFYCRYAHEITVVEPGQIDYFRTELGVPAGRLHCVANGVAVPVRNPQWIAQLRQELGISAGAFAFFFVGRLEPVKDLGTLLEAFAALPPELAVRARLYLVGEGAERAPLEARRDALGLADRVVFLGARSDASRLLMAADAFAMSSKSEGLPMVLLEAMAAGVPCVATAVGGISQLLAEERGLLVPAQSAARLAAAMASIAGSPELRARLAANALQNVRENHSLEAITDRYLELLGLPPTAVGAGTAG
jgi:glycosyltransferase involved in cell wall biosynthesis